MPTIQLPGSYQLSSQYFAKVIVRNLMPQAATMCLNSKVELKAFFDWLIKVEIFKY